MTKNVKIIVAIVIAVIITIIIVNNTKDKHMPTPGQSVNVGVMQAFTGPIESLTPPMAQSAELALREASDSGLFLGGTKINAVRADSTCVDAAAAVTAAERLANADKVIGIVGPSCSGATSAVASKVSATNGVPTVSSSATSPGLSSIEDRGYFFRTVPSDARQGEVLASIVRGKGASKVAVTFTNNDYGSGLASSFSKAFEKLGGVVTISVPHEDDKADYSAEVAALSSAEAQELIIFGYVDKGGKGIIKSALDTGAFSRFVFADGMVGDSLTAAFGTGIDSSYGTMPGSQSEASKKWEKHAQSVGLKLGGPFLGSSYDAAALIVLAAQAAGSVNRSDIQSKILDVANAPGEKIYAGELSKALQILADGGQVDYVGASDIEMSPIGEVNGQYREMLIQDAKFETVKIH